MAGGWGLGFRDAGWWWSWDGGEKRRRRMGVRHGGDGDGGGRGKRRMRRRGGLPRLPGSGLCVLGKLGSPFKSAHVAAFWWLRECAR